jgi:hypothetical protein
MALYLLRQGLSVPREEWEGDERDPPPTVLHCLGGRALTQS